nr:hypothetical protein [Tanacetum cinerariifolium]
GFIDKYVRDPNKTPDSSQRPPHDFPRCGSPVDGLYCRHCALLRKKLKEVWFTICDEHKFFQDFLNTFESSNDDSNVVSMPQEPVVFNQNPGENSSQSPPQIDHHCCYGCGNSLDGIFCQRCTCKSCGKGAHYGYNCFLKVSIISNLKPCHDQNVEEFPQTLPSSHPTCYSGDKNSFAHDSNYNLIKDSPNVFTPSQPPMYSYEFFGDDAHYSYDCPPQVPFIYDPEPCYNQDFNFPQNFQSFQQQYPCCENCRGPHETFQYIIISKLPPCIAITPILSTEEPKDSLIMRDESLITIPEKESNKFIKSSVENLVPNPSESEDECEYDVLDCDDSQMTNFSTFSNPLFDDSTSSDDESSHEEVIHEMGFKTYRTLFLILMRKSFLFDSFLEDFSGELANTDLIPPGINEANYDPEEDVHLVERLLYNNSSPRPSKEFNSKNSDAIIESFSQSPIPVEDSGPFIEEIDLFLASDGSIPLGIDNDYSNSKRDNLFLERLRHDDPIPLPDILDFSNVIRVFLPFFTYPVTSLILLSSGSEDIIFNPGISNCHFSSLEPSVSHRSGTFMKFNVYPNHLNESSMEILSSACFLMDQ